MPAPPNRVTDLLDKIERRLHVRPLNLPAELSKDKWPEKAINTDTIDTFSRFMPNLLLVRVGPEQRLRDSPFYLVDEFVPRGIKIIGVKDIEWTQFSNDSLRQQENYGYGMYDFLSTNASPQDIGLVQARADIVSMYNNNIFVDYVPPNMIKISSVTGADITRGMRTYPVQLLISHASNLMTIPATQMEIFEELAIADVAGFLYGELKYFDGLETVHANMDLKLSELLDAANQRPSIVERLDEAHVTTANANMPYIICG